MTVVVAVLGILLALSLAGLLLAWERVTKSRIAADQQQIRRQNLAEEILVLEQAEKEIEDAISETRRERDQAQTESQRRGSDLETLDADLALWKSKAEHWQQQYEHANADAIKARETVADWIAQRTFGKSIFGQAPVLPERPNIPKPVAKQRIQGRAAVQMAERQFEQEYARLNRTEASAA